MLCCVLFGLRKEEQEQVKAELSWMGESKAH